MKIYHCSQALLGQDPNCQGYISYAQSVQISEVQSSTVRNASEATRPEGLQDSIIRGLKEKAAAQTQELLREREPMSLINEEIIPALDIVGQGFEKKTVYLPQLLMSAEAATAAFEVIKKSFGSSAQESKGKIILATVHGDIHDIGKNIVKVLLENYGYEVIDLGRDVPPETVVEAAEKHKVRMVGLSALMTTTVPAMEETIRQLHEALPEVKVVVGGAVLTPEYAKQIHADYYGRDAMETVRIAEGIFGYTT